jgi:hypothetical protein
MTPITDAPAIQSNTDCAPMGSCNFTPICAIGFSVVEPCREPGALPDPALFRLSPWYDSFEIDGLILDDELLIKKLLPFRGYALRCNPVDSILLAYFHQRDTTRKQQLQLQILESSIITPGIRSAVPIPGGWQSTSYGIAYQELEERQGTWYGGRFTEQY